MKEHSPLDRAALEKDIESSGTKFAVQRLFYELDMCGVQTCLLPSGANPDNIEQTLNQLEIESKGVTVRFSYAKALNLPRGFFRDRKKCLNFILEQNRDYSIIIQEYTKLENSFELYMDTESLYLQVMPGIWEISTNEGPDIIREQRNSLTIWRYNNPRVAKLANEDGSFYMEEKQPFDFDTLHQFYTHLKQYQNRLDMLKGVFTPLCCHFYVDIMGRFSFLNIRDFGNFPINENSPAYFHTVNDSADIDEWDGVKPILFNARAERNNEAPLVATISHLVKRGISNVFVNYGILSHPAILLREAGIVVKQSYVLYDKKVILESGEISESQEKQEVISEKENSRVVKDVRETHHPSELPKTERYVARLDEISDQDINLVGSKALNLSTLRNAGFPVPNGFVITTLAYRKCLDHEGNFGAVPFELQSHIIEEYFNLNPKLVAVRSSATVEDLSKASSAGIYKTTLNISNEYELLNAITEGFQSFNSQEAKRYRLDHFVDDNGEMALIIQKLVDANSSGVIFTQSPDNPSRIMINSAFGLGEPLVSGRMTGDVFKVSEDGKIEPYVSDKQTIMTTRGETELEFSKRLLPSLTEEQIAELTRIAKSIEKLFGLPQDIEFAIKDGKVWILQSRPITR